MVVAALVLLGLGLKTAGEQAALNRFDRQMSPILDAMAESSKLAAAKESDIDQFYQKLATWGSQLQAVTPPASGYRKALFERAKGLVDDLSKYVEKDPIRSHTLDFMQSIDRTIEDVRQTLRNGPQEGGDDHDH